MVLGTEQVIDSSEMHTATNSGSWLNSLFGSLPGIIDSVGNAATNINNSKANQQLAQQNGVMWQLRNQFGMPQPMAGQPRNYSGLLWVGVILVALVFVYKIVK